MAMRKHQAGLTMISWILLIGLIGFAGIFGFKLFPIYMSYNAVNSALTTVAKDTASTDTPAQIRTRISNLFDVNSIDIIKPQDVDIKIDPDTHAIVMSIDYDDRVNFIANIDLVAHFSKTYTAGPH